MDYEIEKNMINLEMRSVIEKATKNELTAENAQNRIEELRAKKIDLEKRQAVEKAPMETRTIQTFGWSDVKNALLEKRAVTSNGAGGVNVVNDIIKAFVDKNKMGNLISKFLGASASAVVPVFAPHLATPAGAAEGATSTGVDSTAVLGAKTLVLKPYISSLAVSEMALMSTSFGAQLPEIFATAYAGAIDKQVIVGSGSGNNGLGVFIASASGVTTDQDIANGAAGNPTVGDLVKLAVSTLAVCDDVSKGAIVMHPTIFSGILADATNGQDPFKYELVTMKILGLPIILSTYAPTTLTAGSYVAVGGDFSKYAMAYASELKIKNIDVVGSDNITCQAVQYMNFAPALGSAFYRLKTV